MKYALKITIQAETKAEIAEALLNIADTINVTKNCSDMKESETLRSFFKFILMNKNVDILSRHAV